MILIKLTSPELIEEFFKGKDSVEVLEPCKIVFLVKEETIKCFPPTTCVIHHKDGNIAVVTAEFNGETIEKKSNKKK